MFRMNLFGHNHKHKKHNRALSFAYFVHRSGYVSYTVYINCIRSIEIGRVKVDTAYVVLPVL